MPKMWPLLLALLLLLTACSELHPEPSPVTPPPPSLLDSEELGSSSAPSMEPIELSQHSIQAPFQHPAAMQAVLSFRKLLHAKNGGLGQAPAFAALTPSLSELQQHAKQDLRTALQSGLEEELLPATVLALRLFEESGDASLAMLCASVAAMLSPMLPCPTGGCRDDELSMAPSFWLDAAVAAERAQAPSTALLPELDDDDCIPSRSGTDLSTTSIPADGREDACPSLTFDRRQRLQWLAIARHQPNSATTIAQHLAQELGGTGQAPNGQELESIDELNRPLACALALQLAPSLATEDEAARLLRLVRALCETPQQVAASVLGATLVLSLQLNPRKLEWTAKERLLAAQFRYDRVQHDEVIDTVAPLLEHAQTHPPQDATQLGNHCQALWLTAMTYRRSKRSPRAVPYYEEMLQSCAEHGDYGQRARFGLAQAALRNDDNQRAREELEAILTSWPTGRYADDALTELIRLDLADGAYEKALNRAEAIIDGTLSGDLAGEALWLLAQEERAFANFDADTASASQETRQRRWVERARASQSDDPSYFSQGRLDYFAAYLARDDAKTAAEAARDAIEAAPFSFYACASAALLSTLDREEAAVTEALNIWQAQIAGLRSEPAIEQRFLLEDSPLARAGLRWALLGHTARAAEWLAPLSEDQDSVAWLVAYSLHLEGRFARSHDLARRKLRGTGQAPKRQELGDTGQVPNGQEVGGTGQAPNGQELRDWQRVADPAHRLYWQIAYPQAYPELVAHYASALELPEALILAIMREESAFQARVESFAHAIGLMQLLASTGIEHAERDLGWTIDAQDLREPEVNIAVGAAFLAHLRKRLHTHPSVVAAGYNAGRGAVGRWLEPEPEALHTFVERIPYTETRDYSKRVSASYMVYQVLYGSSDVQLFELEI